MIKRLNLESIIDLKNPPLKEGLQTDHFGVDLDKNGILYVLVNSQLYRININSSEQDTRAFHLGEGYGLARLSKGTAIIGELKGEPALSILDGEGNFKFRYGFNSKEGLDYPEAIATVKDDIFLLNPFGQLFGFSMESEEIDTMDQWLSQFDFSSRAILSASSEQNCIYAADASSYGSKIYRIPVSDLELSSPELIATIFEREVTSLGQNDGYVYYHRTGRGGSNNFEALKELKLDNNERNFKKERYLSLEKNGEYFKLDFPSGALSAAQINGKTFIASVNRDKVLIFSVEYQEQ